MFVSGVERINIVSFTRLEAQFFILCSFLTASQYSVILSLKSIYYDNGYMTSVLKVDS